MPRTLILYEHSAGLSLFDCKGINEIAVNEKAVQQSIVDFNKFSQMVKLFAFKPFPSTEVALETMNMITEGQPSEFLLDFLARSLPEQAPNSKNKGAITVGVSEPRLAGAIQQQLGINAMSDDIIREILRGIRLHFTKYLEQVKPEDLDLAQLGLAHSYSRSKVKFNQHGDDNMVISAVALLTGLDKDLNTFSMRLREWYSVHFPELSHLVEDHKKYAQCVQVIGNRQNIENVDREALNAILENDDLTERIIEAANNSIGREIEQEDLTRIVSMAVRVEGLANYKTKLSEYLYRRMHNISPNLTALVGERMGAQLILGSGSLTNLAKAPSSTVQLLGSEKALFNALKKHKDTPKYGMIFNSHPVAQAADKDKGRVARSFANKISIAARLDAFGEEYRSGHMGLLMKDMIETKVQSLGTDTTVKPNLESMEEAVIETRRYEQNEGAEEARNPDGMDTIHNISQPKLVITTEESVPETPKKRRKKHHHRQNDQQPQPEEPQAEEVQNVDENPQNQEPAAEAQQAEPEAEQPTEHKKRRRKHRSQESKEEA